jgi:acyl-CoA reductase-like NAD-dependent aldehyde dehydrogenase
LASDKHAAPPRAAKINTSREENSRNSGASPAVSRSVEGAITTYRWSSKDEIDRFPVEDPATGEVITVVQGGGPDEVSAAVEAAHRAFETDWRWRTAAERAALLLRGAGVLEEHADELALIESRENGKPVRDARQNDITFLVWIFRFFGSLVDKLPTDFYDKGPIYAATFQEPLGVVGEIIPFNWPPIHTGGKLAPALAAGNTVVLKPSEQAPLTAIRIVELLNTVLPPDVLHFIPGTGQRVGQPLAGHPKIRLVSFTGSTAAGAIVAAAAAKQIAPAVLELGGKDALVVFDDADLDRALKDTLEGGFYNKGEACTATSRILVQNGVYDAFVARLTEAVAKLKVGRGTDASVHIGPVVTKTQQKRVLDYIQIGIQEGARLAVQAPLPTDPKLKNGFWVAPTLFVDVTPDMRIMRDEIFGPVVTVTRFGDEDEAVSIVNQSDYGLTTAIYSADAHRAFRVSRRIDVGMVFINHYFRGTGGTPFGGTKYSGYGREHAIETLKEFSYTKMVRFPSGLGTIPSWWAIAEIVKEAV